MYAYISKLWSTEYVQKASISHMIIVKVFCIIDNISSIVVNVLQFTTIKGTDSLLEKLLLFFSGYLSASHWAGAVESVLKLDVPWNMLKHQLARVLPDGRIDYSSCLDQYVIETGPHKVLQVT